MSRGGQALAAGAVLAAVAALGYLGEMDRDNALAEQAKQCRLVGHHLADTRQGVPAIDRRGWPEPSPGWYDKHCEPED